MYQQQQVQPKNRIRSILDNSYLTYSLKASWVLWAPAAAYSLVALAASTTVSWPTLAADAAASDMYSPNEKKMRSLEKSDWKEEWVV